MRIFTDKGSLYAYALVQFPVPLITPFDMLGEYIENGALSRPQFPLTIVPLEVNAPVRHHSHAKLGR